MSREPIKLVRERDLMAEVEVELTGDDLPWGPHLSVADAQRLDRVRAALRAGAIDTAAQFGRVYRLTPVGVTG